MNRQVIINAMEDCKDDTRSFWVWMHGYLSAGNVDEHTDTEHEWIHVDCNGGVYPLTNNEDKPNRRGWIKWRAIPKGNVEIARRSGSREKGDSSGFEWTVEEGYSDPQDIIAYRIVDE